MSKKPTPNQSINAFLQEEKSRAKGMILGTSVVLLGIFMIVFLFFWSSNSQLATEETNFQPIKVNYNNSKDIPRAFGKMKPDWIVYDGSFQPFSKVTFKLRSFDPKATYVFDFGDRIQKVCKNGIVNHFYKRDGRYKVSVSVKYDNQEAIAWTKKITISSKKDFDIDPRAYREY